MQGHTCEAVVVKINHCLLAGLVYIGTPLQSWELHSFLAEVAVEYHAFLVGWKKGTGLLVEF